MQRRIRRVDFTTLLGASLVATALPGCGPRAETLAPLPQAPSSFGGAVDAIRALVAHDAANPKIASTALPRLYHHGKLVRRAVVLFHGFTNSPQQYDELARRLHARGCNVYVPRMPRHGYKDRITRDLANITIADLQACAKSAFDVASRLGATVSATGISLGGSLVLWLAQTQPIDLTVPVAPFLTPIQIAPGAVHAVMHALRAIPSMYWWWDVRVREGSKPPYAYPGYPTHALAEMVFFGDAVLADAAAAAPRGRRCVLVLNEHDNAVDNRVARRLLALWNGHGARYRELVLTGLGGPHHDVVDPTTFPQARTLVYPELESLLLA